MFEKLKTLLFGEPKPIPQVELNIGKLTATILFKTGDQIVKTFEGEYIESVWMGFSRFWYDCYVTANERFLTWKEKCDKRGMYHITKDKYLPPHEIAEIYVEKSDKFVTTNRQ